MFFALFCFFESDQRACQVVTKAKHILQVGKTHNKSPRDLTTHTCGYPRSPKGKEHTTGGELFWQAA